ncbi:MAG: Spy/CpxP family protein refolding chaperone [Bdellovibrionales bacterium]
MNTKLISRYTFAILLALALSSHAEARRGDFDGKGGINKKIMKELNLSSEQKTQIKAIKKEEKKDRRGKKEFRKELKKSMHQAIIDLNENDMRKIHKQLQDMRMAHSNSRFENLIKLLKILTPEQRVEFAELQKKNKDHRRGRRGMKRDYDDNDEATN